MKHTETIRLKEPDGTYLIELAEVKRRKLTTEDELLPIIAQLASDAQQAVQNSSHLLIGEKDVFLAFARRFLAYVKKDPKLFSDFLEYEAAASPSKEANLDKEENHE